MIITKEIKFNFMKQIIILILTACFIYSCTTDRGCGKCISINDIHYVNSSNTAIKIRMYKNNISYVLLNIDKNKDTTLFNYDNFFSNQFDSAHIVYDTTKIKRYNFTNNRCSDNRNIFCENNYIKSSIFTYTFTAQDYIEADTIK
jgi:predicted small secreted protein